MLKDVGDDIGANFLICQVISFVLSIINNCLSNLATNTPIRRLDRHQSHQSFAAYYEVCKKIVINEVSLLNVIFSVITALVLLACENQQPNEYVVAPVQGADEQKQETAAEITVESAEDTLDSFACGYAADTGVPKLCVDFEELDANGEVSKNQTCAASLADFQAFHLLLATSSGVDLNYHISDAAPACTPNPTLDQQTTAETAAIAAPVGVIDNIEEGVIRGWACAPGSIVNITVHLYAGGPIGIGTLVQELQADQAAITDEDLLALQTSCNHPLKNRFRYKVTLDNLANISGQAIHAYAIHPSGAPPLNRVMVNSGNFAP